VIEKILPSAAACAESIDGMPGAGLFAEELFPEEKAVVARATEKRRREFAAVRACARSALADLGVPPGPILPGLRGAPQWPPGIVGSMTHCHGYCAAAVARRQQLITIGVDAEPDEPLPGGVLELISLPAERARVRDLAAAAAGISWDRLLFCAKEAVYKAWFPLNGQWLGFTDADISIDPVDRTFSARLLVPAPVLNGAPLSAFAGRWQAADGLLMAAVTVPA
jgi:enterobactin synthetase component D / holo-[acyl-carrier protein] synthase